MKPTLMAPAVLTALLSFSMTATAQPPDDEGTFQAAVSYPAGQYPWSIAAGDFNEDAAVDLAVANLGSRVSVLLGNGDGSFQAPVSYAAGYYPAFVTVGDLNGDGHDDLVVAGHYSDEISVLLGHGDGTFQAPVTHATGSEPKSIAEGDLDGDGRADLVLAPGDRSGVRVMLGSGGGAFLAPASYGEGTYPLSIALGDFNGDDRVDLAAAGGSGGVSVLLGNGGGTFQEAGRASSASSDSITAGDFNGDGKTDLAAVGYGRSDVGVLLGNGDGTFQAEASYGPDLIPWSVVAGDFNADGRDDLAAVNYERRGKSGELYRGRVALLLANDDGTFQPAVHYGAGSYPRALAVADFNGDGKTDLAVANSLSFDVSVLLNGPVTTTTTMHVGTIDSHAKFWLDQSWWRTDIVVRAHDAGHVALPGTIVSGAWDDGRVSSCVTDVMGTCVIARSLIPAAATAVTFTVTTLTNPTHPEHAYDAAANHDPNGDSDGTSITVVKP